jgi:hypothetical protein
MGFRAVLKNEQGEVLQSLPRYHGQLATWSQRAEYPMLGHVDPYGDTVFNHLQMKTLESELKGLPVTAKDDQAFAAAPLAYELLRRLARPLCRQPAVRPAGEAARR